MFIKDYLKVFPRDQIMIQRLEDIAANQTAALTKVFKFLGLSKYIYEMSLAISLPCCLLVC